MLPQNKMQLLIEVSQRNYFGCSMNDSLGVLFCFMSHTFSYLILKWVLYIDVLKAVYSE